MSKLIAFFTNRIVISVIGLIALSIIIWFVGPVIKFGADNYAPLASEFARLIAIMILLLLWGLNNLRIQLRQRKHNEDLVQDLEQNQAMAAEAAQSDLSSEEVQVLKQRFSDALTTLSKLKFSGRFRSKALYELPWYIIIGPPGSGKTTALVNSSLEFPLAEQFGKAALQGVGGTRNCDWWFTNEAVLIDTAGRYTTQDSHQVVDSSAWEAFLDLLKKNRRRRPVNGVLVAISVHDLLFQSEQERIQHAKIIRTRIDELMQKLEIRFPLYLIFTKSDLISGFAEFFEDLSREDREQVWGISLPNAADASQSPNFEFFDAELERLIERLYDREIHRLHQERDVRRRALIQGFPQQVENIKGIVSGFVKQTFVKNRYEYQPYLRGIYFTSGTQDGTPIDRLMSAVSANFGFNREQLQAQHGQGKSFFLGRLFRDVVFPESELVGSNRKYELFIKWSRRLTYAVLAFAAVGLIATWIGSLNRHGEFMREVHGYVSQFEQEREKIKDWNRDMRVVAPALNALARASIVYDQEEHPWLSGFGLYDANVDRAANEAYAAQLQHLLLPRLLQFLETRIAEGHSGGDLYHNFRVYLMFNKLEHMDSELVGEWFAEQWKRQMPGEASNRQALEQHLRNLLQLEIAPAELNPGLVRQTRQLLLRVPVHQRIYSRIRTRAEFRQKVDLLNLFGESVRETFALDEGASERLQVPFMFTREGYDAIDFSTDSPVIADIVRERWVLADNDEEKVDFVEADLEEISARVEALYQAEFIQHWNQVLATLDVAEFQSVSQAAEVLNRFVDPVYSPLQAILQVTAENTQLSPQLPGRLEAGDEESAGAKISNMLAANMKSTPVDKQFKALNSLLREGNNSPPPIAEIFARLTQLREFVGEITVAPDADKKAFEIALARFNKGSGNALTSLAKFADNRPQPVKRWLDTISDQSWKVILIAARRHINNEWKSQVYGFYREAIAGRYPISAESRNELAQLDFNDFFKPGGKVDAFFNSHIKPFVDTRKNWSNKTVDGRSLGLNGNALKQIRRALTIKNVFFRMNPEAAGISLQLKPHRLDKKDARFRLDVGDQRISYSHGPRFWRDLVWSAQDENSRVRIVFEDLDGKISQRDFEGPWAWLRLQDEARISETKQANVYQVEYNLDSPDISRRHSMIFLIKARSINNPFNQKLLSNFRCPETI